MPPEAAPALSLRGVVVGYGADVRFGVADVALERGALLQVIGANGAGKSTLLRTVAGLQPPIEGTIQVAGASGELPKAAAHLAYVGQRGAPPGTLTAGEYIRYRVRAGGLARKRARAITAETASTFDADHLLDVRCSELSGGQANLVRVMAAMAADPVVALLDEVFAAMDPLVLERVWAAIERHRDEGLAVVLVSHQGDGPWSSAPRRSSVVPVRLGGAAA